MFERYTERARRVLFFARYEASQLGSISIETERLLLALIREGKGLTSRIFARSHLSLENIRKEIEGRTVFREKVSTSVEIPFSAETKRVLQFAAEEADRLLHNYIGTEHLLLGILREERSVAASILMEKGRRLTSVREDSVQLLNEKTQLARVKELTDNPNIIVFIAELHTLVGAGSAEGSLDAANILKPALSRGEIRCIGATTPAEYRKYIEKDRSLERRFQAIKVDPPGERETIEILLGVKDRYENFHHGEDTRESIEAAVYQTNRYITDRFLPDKAIDLVDEAGARAK